ECERRRLAVFLHDEIGQRLALAKLNLQSICAGHKSEDEFTKVFSMLDETIEKANTLVFECGSSVLYELGLDIAVEQWLGEELKDKYGIDYEYVSSAKLKLDRETRVILFRSIREILVNVIKHAAAGRVKVQIEKKPGFVEVNIEDDGDGFDISGFGLNQGERHKGGFGLFSIREQFEYLGGKFDIESRLKMGTKVCMTLPIANQNNAETQK
ncbi:MAG: ATP-binding protein, partial [Phycisphaerae bacterium]|nr:ATP-binding protein [Phycisphaerae bacterium]